MTTGHEEYISRKQVIDAAKPAHMWIKEWHKVNSQDGKTSPEMSKKSKAKQLKSPQTQPPEVLVDLPDSAVNSKGVTEAVHQFLEVSLAAPRQLLHRHLVSWRLTVEYRLSRSWVKCTHSSDSAKAIPALGLTLLWSNTSERLSTDRLSQ